MQKKIADLENQNVGLQTALYTSRNLTYIALGTALLAVLAVAMLFNRSGVRTPTGMKIDR